MTVTTSPPTERSVVVRPIEEADVPAAARIAYEAFADIAHRHGFPPDFPAYGDALELVAGFTEHPSIWGVVAEAEGRVVGSVFLDERAVVRGLGPITVDPSEQAGGIGRRLMTAALERASRGEGVRLLQDSFNPASLALYTSLGFEVVAPVVLVAGVPSAPRPEGVRPLDEADLAACGHLCRSVHGYARTAELRDALAAPGLTPVVAHRDGRLVAYATTFADFGAAHAVAETEDDLFALIAGAASPVSFLLPLDQHMLVRRCLAAGLRFVKPMTYLVAGAYQRPLGAWIPTVLS
jgi:predicted N-acetyltransferase YhbS